ncbi:hypothetical protein [Arsenicibacter rosenii]|uniref:PKD domain-containing protein n=1 Tax=Arsenicibacter rosenii TaxID=1750698 RepID=A0A1S2VQ65_9BACT|nr:hypothetical protein [Arsenicibacter rosenii]OIN60902.1 hypothetical protein BLX24_02070 [Arsenicibacter rosenii]
MMSKNGQQEMTDRFHFLDICCRRVSEAYGKPDRSRWTNGDYVELERIVFKKSHVRISPNTLKRIFGKIKTDARYYPQKATRDALAYFIDYKDWDTFVGETMLAERLPEASNPGHGLPEPPLPERVPAVFREEKPKGAAAGRRPVRSRSVILLLAATVLLTVIGMMMYISQVHPPVVGSLVCRNPVGENPHSALFAVHRKKGAEEAVFTIRFGDGKRRQIEPEDSVYTHYYERPGRYYATLWQGSTVIDTAVVYLLTNGWTVTASMMHDTTRVYPILHPDGRKPGRQHVGTSEAAHAGIDTNRTYFVEFTNTRQTAIDGDNFELTAAVKTSPERAGVRCSQVGVTIFGESSFHTFDVMRPGCVHWIDLQLSELHKSGQHDDLGFLGADLRNGGRLTLQVADQTARLSINGRQVYQARYTKPLHQIYGVKIRFAGVGSIDSFQLRDLKTKKPFAGNF